MFGYDKFENNDFKTKEFLENYVHGKELRVKLWIDHVINRLPNENNILKTNNNEIINMSEIRSTYGEHLTKDIEKFISTSGFYKIFTNDNYWINIKNEFPNINVEFILEYAITEIIYNPSLTIAGRSCPHFTNVENLTKDDIKKLDNFLNQVFELPGEEIESIHVDYKYKNLQDLLRFAAKKINFNLYSGNFRETLIPGTINNWRKEKLKNFNEKNSIIKWFNIFNKKFTDDFNENKDNFLKVIVPKICYEDCDMPKTLGLKDQKYKSYDEQDDYFHNNNDHYYNSSKVLKWVLGICGSGIGLIGGGFLLKNKCKEKQNIVDDSDDIELQELKESLVKTDFTNITSKNINSESWNDNNKTVYNPTSKLIL